MTYRVEYMIRYSAVASIAGRLTCVAVAMQKKGSMIIEADGAARADNEGRRVLRDAVDYAVRSGLFGNVAEERILSVLPCEPPRPEWSEVLAVALAKMNGG